MNTRKIQGNKDNQIRYKNVAINNYRQDKKEYIADQLKGGVGSKREC
tara:strand:+ start:258 stop:398 length:141 start_codon:yes stop_codon:yes gene_type:complete